MGKLIFLLIIIGFIYFLFKKNQPLKNESSEPNISKNNNDDNEFIQCDSCKTFILKKETIKKNGKYYCKECYANT